MSVRGMSYRKAVVLSALGHGIALWFVLAPPVSEQVVADAKSAPEGNVVAFNVSLASSEGIAVAEEAPAIAVANADPREEQAAVAAAPDLVDEVAGDAGDGGSSSVEKMVWTPLPPKALDRVSDRPDIPAPSAVISQVELPGELIPAKLLSFEPAAFDDDALREEARRLSGGGLVQMNVQIDDEGVPIGCSVVESSGSNLIDDFACSTVLNYRYEPARTVAGKARYSSAYEYLEWSDGSVSALVPETTGSEALLATGSGVTATR